MIMMRLMGGLGNQMFQYAFGRKLAAGLQTELVLDQTFLLDKSSEHSITTHRDFDLDIFKNITFRWATANEITAYNGAKNESLFSKLDRKLNAAFSARNLVVQKNNAVLNTYFNVKNNTCLVGRWQSYRFFIDVRSIIENDFSMDTPAIPGLQEMLNRIVSKNSVCLHVRRGDLVTSPIYSQNIGVLPQNYYANAIRNFNERLQSPTYFIFSDDVEWCRNNIITDQESFIVDASLSGRKSEGHFFLMQSCKHFIISNSTFAWWAAWLAKNRSKEIIYPKLWYRDPNLQNTEMCPPEWTAL